MIILKSRFLKLENWRQKKFSPQYIIYNLTFKEPNIEDFKHNFFFLIKEECLSTSGSKAMTLIALAWKEAGGKGSGKLDIDFLCSRKEWMNSSSSPLIGSTSHWHKEI